MAQHSRTLVQGNPLALRDALARSGSSLELPLVCFKTCSVEDTTICEKVWLRILVLEIVPWPTTQLTESPENLPPAL